MKPRASLANDESDSCKTALLSLAPQGPKSGAKGLHQR